jgi:hypothetical protein
LGLKTSVFLRCAQVYIVYWLQELDSGMKSGRSLRDLFAFPGFVAATTLKGVFGDPKVRIVTLRRRKKRRCAATAVTVAAAATTRASAAPATCGWPAGSCTWSSNAGGSGARDAAACT